MVNYRRDKILGGTYFIDEQEKNELVENFDWSESLKHSRGLPKFFQMFAFIKHGLPNILSKLDLDRLNLSLSITHILLA